MDSNGFKNAFGDIARSSGFEAAFDGWFKESTESIVVLHLQKSNFGDYYEMNIKVYIQGTFGKTYRKNKELVKKYMGNIFTRQPPEYRDMFDFDTSMDDEDRMEKLRKLFNQYITPLTSRSLSKSGLMQLANDKEIYLLPTIEEELLRLVKTVSPE